MLEAEEGLGRHVHDDNRVRGVKEKRRKNEGGEHLILYLHNHKLDAECLDPKSKGGAGENDVRGEEHKAMQKERGTR